MTTIREAYLPVLDLYRGMLASTWDLRRYDVTVRVNTWSGALVGEGTKTTVNTPLLVNGQRPKVTQVTQKQIIMSHGLYQDQDLMVGPLTPPFAGGGTAVIVFDPSNAAPNVELLFVVSGGPGDTDAGGDFYRLVAQEDTHNFRYMIVLRRTGESNG